MPSGPPIELSAQGGQSYAVGPERKADPTLLTQHTTWDGWAGKRAKQERTLRTGDTAVVYSTILSTSAVDSSTAPGAKEMPS